MDTTILDTMTQQIGMMNVLAISGGRRVAVSETILELPVNHGYTVRVTYNPVPDLYTVERLLRRGGKETVKGTLTEVYCDELSEAAYGASCYNSYRNVVNNRWAD